MHDRINRRIGNRISNLLLVTLAVLALAPGLPQLAWAETKPVGKGAATSRVEYDRLPLAELVRRANRGELPAQFELGSRFNYGRGVPKNVNMALRWLRSAAQRGHVEAQRLLALKFYHGYDVAADHGEALQWAARLAESGDLPGQMMLANMYANGEGTPRHLVRAYAWYDIAAATARQAVEHGDGSVSTMLDAVVEQREKTAALLLPAEEVEAQQLASDWWLRKMGAGLAPTSGAKAKPRSGR